MEDPGGACVKKLNSRQRAFADNYIISGNATEAARKAGYSEKTARQMGSENLTKPYILEYIQRRTAPAEQERIMSADQVLQFFTRVVDGREAGASMPDRINAAREILKRDVSEKKLEIELLKLESRQEHVPQDEDVDNAMLRALDSAAAEVWGGDGDGGAADGLTEETDNS